MAKGLLIQRKGPVGVVMTSDGRFARIFLWGKNHTLGQEVQGTEIKFPSYIQGAVAAAVMLVMVMGLWVNLLVNPAAAAYVALDINPSLELTVNRSGTVIKAVGLDEDGQKLLAQVATMDRELYQAVDLLVAGAVQYHYLNETNNVVLATVTATKEDEAVVDEEKLQTTVQQTVATLPVEVKVVTELASQEEHQQAAQKGVSVGRYLIHQNSKLQGKKITLEEVKQKGLGQLEKEKGIEIQLVLPHAKYQVKVKDAKKSDAMLDKKATGNQVQFVPPGQLKKDREPGYTVDIHVKDSKGQGEQGKKYRDKDDARDQDDADEDDDKRDSAKRRDDRRPSHLDTQVEEKIDKDKSQEQKKDKDKEKDKDKKQQKDKDKEESDKKFDYQETNEKNKKDKE